MNNQQFRRLVLDTPTPSQNGAEGAAKSAAPPAPSAFGSRSRSSIPMTPRNVRGSVERNFARQLAERDASKGAGPKFKASSAPKGTKLAAGYNDRTKDRQDEETDDRSRRIKALEEQLKLDQIDQQTFERLRDEITGGDIGATHLVKGLDRKLLERVRRGENVMEDKPDDKDGASDEPVADVDAELDAIEMQEIAPVTRESVVKKGEMAPLQAIAGGKRKRDAILAELKASRRAAAEAAAAAQPQLGSKFKKFGSEPRVEIDERGREVMVVVGEDGKVKRKVRKARAEAGGTDSGLLEVDKGAAPLGIDQAELPQAPAVEPEDEDDDIFEGVGAEYDPLAALGEDSDAEHADGSDQKPPPAHERSTEPSGHVQASARPRNYFNDSGPAESVFEKPDEASILQTLKKASQIASKAEDAEGTKDGTEDPERLKRRAAMLAARDRDMDDIDMGFGSSRFDDAEEAETNERSKLSEWKGAGAEGEDGDGDQHDRGGKKRKRGPKKKKGDKDSAADVMKVLERRQAD